MQAKELKKYLSEDTDRIVKVLEHFNFHNIWLRNDELRCATPTGDNNTSVSIRVDEELFSSSYSDLKPYHGDIYGLIEVHSNKTFVDIIRDIHTMFSLPIVGNKNKKKIDMLADFRPYMNRRRVKSNEDNKKFNRDILNKYMPRDHVSMLEEAISPKVLRQFDVRFDAKREQIIMPHYDWKEHDYVVGIKSRITMDGETAEEFGVSKYTNIIKGYKKTNNLYGWHLAHEHVNDKKMLIIFESEKSVMKHFTIERGDGFSVSTGGHDRLSLEQKRFIVQNTGLETEIVFAFDKDISTQAIEGEAKKGEPTQFIQDVCKDIATFRKVSFIYDRFGLLQEKDSPIDRGLRIWKFLLSDRMTVE